MMMGRYLLIVLLVSLSFVGCVSARTIGTASIPAPAVIPNTGSALTMIDLNVTAGSGNVTVVGPATVGSDTLQSAQTAARYASTYLGLNFTKYNFAYTIVSDDSNVTGPSGGAAMTLLAISALGNKKLRTDFTITGTVNSDGSIGEIGGVYDKVEAAYQNGLHLVLVPTATYGDESKLYLLVQDEFGVPLVQVSNITQASRFAFNASIGGLPYEATYDLGTNYSFDSLPTASTVCSNQCNESAFGALANYTLNSTGDMIAALGSSKFQGVKQQLYEALAQSAQVFSHGYLYASANFAFQDYLNAVYFGAHDTTKGLTLSSLEDVQTLCSSIVQPQITESDYEYVMGAELRQGWGNYTVNQALSGYNGNATDTDEVLNAAYLGAEASGWCNAAGFTYGYFANSTDNPISFSPTLSGIAMEKLAAVSRQGYGGMYFDTAQQAYQDKNYPLAMLGADYAFTLANASTYGGQTTQQLLADAQSSMQQNATYGVWATEFAKESQFYAYQAGATGNVTLAHSYALQAYTAARLAEQMGSDIKLIYDNRVSVTGSTGNTALEEAYLATANRLAVMEKLMVIMLAMVVLTLSANLTMIAILIKRSASKDNKKKVRRKTPKSPNGRRRRR